MCPCFVVSGSYCNISPDGKGFHSLSENDVKHLCATYAECMSKGWSFCCFYEFCIPTQVYPTE